MPHAGCPDHVDNCDIGVTAARFGATFTGLKLIERPVERRFVQHSTSQFLLIRWSEHEKNRSAAHVCGAGGGVGGEPICHEKSSEEETQQK